MKKEIESLLASENASLKINPICTLHRWQKHLPGNLPIDGLTVEFSIIARPDITVDIKSRDWQGVLAEVEAAQQNFLLDISAKLTKDLRNGYMYGGEVQANG